MRRSVLALLATLGLACAALGVDTARTTLSIKGMTSDERAAVVERHLRQAAGVTEFKVRRDVGEAEFSYDPNETDPATIAEILQKAGFGIRLLPWEFADASFKGCSNGWCGSRRPNAKVGPQPGAALGQDVYCPVSGVVLRVKDSTLHADLDGKPLYVCCEGCLRYLQANREKVLALRGLAFVTAALPAVGGDATAKTTLTIKGMTCGGCAAGVKIQLKRTEGVTAYQVSFEKGEAEVSYDPAKTTPEKIAASVSKTGFAASVKKPGADKAGH